MNFFHVLGHAFNAYRRNIKLISFFSIPFLISLPLALALPNFTALGGIFLRFGSIRYDLALTDALIIFAALVLSLLLFSFAVVAINLVIKSQRTLLRLTSRDIEKIEEKTFKLFWVYAIVFVIALAVNYFLYDFGLHTTIGAFVSFLVALFVMFAGQALVLEDLDVRHVMTRSASLIGRKTLFVIGFFVVAIALILINTAIFLAIGEGLGEHALLARYAAIVVNALLILPFLECLKVQVYLSKYSLLN